MLKTENDLRDALHGLRTTEPSEAQIARALAADDARPQPLWRTRRRLVLAAGGVGMTALAVTIVGFALPAGSPPDGPAPGHQASAFNILTAAAASAATRPVTQGAFSYRKALIRSTIGHTTPFGDATYVTEEPVETWVGRDGNGVHRPGSVRLVETTGSPAAQRWRGKGSFGGGSVDGAKRLKTKPSRSPDGSRTPEVLPYRPAAGGPPGSAASLDPGTLPTDPDVLERRLGRTREAKPGTVENATDARANLLSAEIALLTDGRTPPAVRSALFTVMARTPGATADGRGPDATGRIGERISVALPADRHLGPETYRLIVDPETSQLLEWSKERPIFDAVGASAKQADFDLFEAHATRTVLVDQRQVETAPSLPPQPAHCTDGVTPGLPFDVNKPNAKLITVTPRGFFTTPTGRRHLAAMRKAGNKIVRITRAQHKLLVADHRGCRPGG